MEHVVSFWWDRHVGPENSKWLAENCEGFEQNAKEILKLIEDEEVSSELYDHKRPELITRIAEFSCMHRVLAERYEHLVAEVHRNCPSLTEMSHPNMSDSSSLQASQMQTPDHINSVHKFSTPIGFDVLLSSGGDGSDVSVREGSESSFLLSSDSDSESCNSINKLIASPVKDDALKLKEIKGLEMFPQQIANYEDKLVSLNKGLQNSVETRSNLKPELKENESVAELTSTIQSQLELVQHDIKTQNACFVMEQTKVVELQKQVAELQIVISDSNSKMGIMEEELEASRQKLIAAEDEISKLKHELSSKISEETRRLQGQLESNQRDMALLQGQLYAEKNRVVELQDEVSLYVADIAVHDDQIGELKTEIKQSKSETSVMKSTHEAKDESWKADAEKLKMELKGKCESIEDLKKNLNTFKQKYDTLKSEKDGVNAQLDTLRAEMHSKDNLMQELKNHLNTLQVEHMGVNASIDGAQKLTNELRLKVEELEREVDKQREVISDRAEEKREVIRQLCFSLEHYQSGYKKVRQAYIWHKRHAGLAS